MRPRHGPLYSAVVLRPLTEQLVAVLGVRPGDTACDLICDGGTLTRELVLAVGPSGSVYAADVDAELARLAAGPSASDVSAPLTLTERHVPLARGACDRVASLLTLGFAPHVFADASRVVKPGGRVACMAWDPGSPPAHEYALEAALERVLGVRSPFVTAVLAPPPSAAVIRHRILDVARFDGPAQLWSALVEERPIAGELERVPAERREAVRDAVMRELQQFEAADATLRIPIQAVVFN